MPCIHHQLVAGPNEPRGSTDAQGRPFQLVLVKQYQAWRLITAPLLLSCNLAQPAGRVQVLHHRAERKKAAAASHRPYRTSSTQLLTPAARHAPCQAQDLAGHSRLHHISEQADLDWSWQTGRLCCNLPCPMTRLAAAWSAVGQRQQVAACVAPSTVVRQVCCRPTQLAGLQMSSWDQNRVRGFPIYNIVTNSAVPAPAITAWASALSFVVSTRPHPRP